MAKHAKRLSELSLRGRRVLFLSKLALLRGNAANIANSLIVRAYQLVMRIVKWRQPQLTRVSNATCPRSMAASLQLLQRAL